MRYFFSLVLVFLAAMIGAEEPVFEVHISPSADQVSIKDTLDVSLDFIFPAGYQVDVASLQQNVLRSSSFYEHPFSIVDIKIEDRQKTANGNFSQRMLLKLQPLRLGELSLTFYDISFVPEGKDKKIHKVISPIFPIHVAAVEAPQEFQGRLAPLLTFSKKFPLELDEKNQILLIEDPQTQKRERQINVQQMNQKRFPWISIGSVLLAILVFWIFLKHPPAKPALTPEQMAKAAKKNALLALEQLKAKQLPEKGFFDEFYVQLTAPVRTYLERRYHVPASTSTTSEFLEETAKNQALSSQTRQQLGQFLSQADKVKFGRYRPSIEECEKAQELAVQFINTD